MSQGSNQNTCRELSTFLNRNKMKEFYELLSKSLRSQGTFSSVAEETGLNRESLYKTLSGKRDPNLSTILSLLDYLGIEIEFKVTSKSLERVLSGVSGFEGPWLDMYLATPGQRLKNADRALEQFKEINK